MLDSALLPTDCCWLLCSSRCFHAGQVLSNRVYVGAVAGREEMGRGFMALQRRPAYLQVRGSAWGPGRITPGKGLVRERRVMSLSLRRMIRGW